MAHKQELADLFEDAASTVPAPSFAADAWMRARRVRRRRRTVIGLTAAAAVLAVTATAVLPLRGAPDPNVAATAAPTIPAPPYLGVPAVHQMPDKLPRRSIAGLPTDAAAMLPTSAPNLSEHPIDRAVAVVQPYGPEGSADISRPVYVLGTDGSWVNIDGADLVLANDAHGNKGIALRNTSLSPDRRRVAIPQPGSLVVVDLTKAKVHRIAVPGLNEQVLWVGNRTVLVQQEGAAPVSVDWAAGTVTTVRARLSIADSAVEQLDGGTVLELPATGDGSGFEQPGSVRLWRLDRAAPDRETSLNDAKLAPGYGVLQWQGPTLHNGSGRLVRAGWGTSDTFSGNEILAVVNANNGVVERLLNLGRDRYKACCRPLEWVDDDTVLVHTEKEGLISWDVRTGAVAQVVAGPIEAVVSIRLATS